MNTTRLTETEVIKAILSNPELTDYSQDFIAELLKKAYALSALNLVNAAQVHRLMNSIAI